MVNEDKDVGDAGVDQEDGDAADLVCQCGDAFSEHEKPPNGISWDACSFPCLKCECQEFVQKEIA